MPESEVDFMSRIMPMLRAGTKLADADAVRFEKMNDAWEKKEEAQKEIFAKPGRATILSFDDLTHLVEIIRRRPISGKFTSDVYVTGKFSREFGSAMANVSKTRSQSALLKLGAAVTVWTAPATGGLSLIPTIIAGERGIAMTKSISEAYMGSECDCLYKNGYRIATNNPDLVLLKMKSGFSFW